MAPRGDHKSGSGAIKKGLPLARSIVQRIDSFFESITGRVGSHADWAASKHQGSKAHVIRAKGKMLKFEWERGRLLVKAGKRKHRGKFFFFKKVMHPGDKRPVRYLTTPMHLYARANGFRTTSQPVNRTRLP